MSNAAHSWSPWRAAGNALVSETSYLCFTYVVLCPFKDKLCFFIFSSVSDAMYYLYSNITLVYVRGYYVL